MARGDSGDFIAILDKLKQVRTLRVLGTSTLSVVSAFFRSPRQLLQSDTGVPHFALDPLTYRRLLSLSPAADFAEPRPPRHKYYIKTKRQ